MISNNNFIINACNSFLYVYKDIITPERNFMYYFVFILLVIFSLALLVVTYKFCIDDFMFETTFSKLIAFMISIPIIIIFLYVCFSAFYNITDENPKYILSTKEWSCTTKNSSIRYVMIGKVLTPQKYSYCVEYKRN